MILLSVLEDGPTPVHRRGRPTHATSGEPYA